MSTEVVNPAVEVHDLTVSYDRKPVLWDIDFSVPAGCLAGIIGPNGSGKTTLIKAIMGLVPINSGYVKLFNKSVAEVRTQVSYIPQRETVDWNFPASVKDVVMMGRYGKRGLFRRLTAEDENMVHECLKKVGMADLANRQIARLSGGQQQRIFLARALAQDALLYLMDEPFNGIDATTEEDIMNILREMRLKGKTILVVHHDLQSAMEYFDWFILLNTRLVAYGPRKEVFTPHLLQETYGGRLSLLTQISDLLKEKDFPMRETG
ncbi:MAG: manganese transport system ATP-binding protein MntB [Chitinophagales bacterium]|nr:MAG: manganese transport system ATP-binding protein MntB [Chitinophagales bacterium]